MALSYQKIISLACATAKTPGYLTIAGDLLNMILGELCQDYDFETARKSTTFNFNGSFGPYALPSDYLRSVAQDVFYNIQVGLPYFMVWTNQADFDRLLQQPQLAGYPSRYWTDMSTSPPGMYVWPMPSGTYQVFVHYYSRMADMASPETSNAVPWFPSQPYLLARLTGELMKLADDPRAGQFLGDATGANGEIEGARHILSRYMKMKDDKNNQINTVLLDRRRFATVTAGLPESKSIDWGSTNLATG